MAQPRTNEEVDARGLCATAERDPDEVITRFTIEDYALALIRAAREPADIVVLLREARTPALANALLEASGWEEIFTWFA